jgi:hypothetical protein
MGALIGSYVELYLLIAVDTADDTMTSVVANADAEGSQDVCTATAPAMTATVVDVSEVVFDVTAESAIGGDSLPLSTTQVELSFAEDGTLAHLAMEFEMDFRAPDFVETLGEGADGCDLMSAFGLTCEPCSGDAEPFCLDIRVEDVEVSSSLAMVAIIDDDECHPDCADCTAE